MSKLLLLKPHRWTSLLFALPLFAIVASGLVLSFEPMIQVDSIVPQSLDASRLADLIQRHDPQGKARGLFINSTTHRLTLQGVSAAEIDLVTGETSAARPILSDIFLWARLTHERLLGLPWLVTASTIAMIVVMTLGISMGLPRLRNSLSGWHRGTAWFTLPLIVLSPITGFCMALGLTFQTGSPPAGRPVSLPEAVRLVAKSQDLARVTSIGSRGGRMMARIYDGDELRAYAINSDGVVALPRNWPRLIHEGNWAAMIAGPLNIVTSVVLLGLLSTGLLIWARRKFRRPGMSAKEPIGRSASLGSTA
jgi:uncharacterized iron-regulated membrane protein